MHSAPPRTGDGWISGTDLLTDPDALAELIAHDAREGLARYGRPPRPDVAAGFGLHRFSWPTALLFTLPWFLERRVPLLTPEDVSIRRATGELTARPGAFVCLPDDPAAGLPGARTVADEAALAAELRTALAGFLAPVLTAFRPAVRRSPRMLWAMATDAVVEGLWYVGGLLGEEERARAELSDLLAPDRADDGPAGSPGAPGGQGVHARRVRAVLHPRRGLRDRRCFGHRPCPGQLLPGLHRAAGGDVRRLPPRHAKLTASAFGRPPESPEFRGIAPLN